MLVDTTACNPIYPKSIRFCDIKDGLEFIELDTRTGYIFNAVFRGYPHKNPTNSEDADFVYYEFHLYNTGPQHVLSRIDQLGIIKKANGSWSDIFLINNSADDRKEFALWLSKNNIPHKEEFIYYLSKKYPESLEGLSL